MSSACVCVVWCGVVWCGVMCVCVCARGRRDRQSHLLRNELVGLLFTLGVIIHPDCCGGLHVHVSHLIASSSSLLATRFLAP